jgi:hypothetical protein
VCKIWSQCLTMAASWFFGMRDETQIAAKLQAANQLW